MNWNNLYFINWWGGNIDGKEWFYNFFSYCINQYEINQNFPIYLTSIFGPIEKLNYLNHDGIKIFFFSRCLPLAINEKLIGFCNSSWLCTFRRGRILPFSFLMQRRFYFFFLFSHHSVLIDGKIDSGLIIAFFLFYNLH